MRTRTVLPSIAIGGAYATLIVVGPLCVAPMLDLLAIPLSLVAEYVLLAGLVSIIAETPRLAVLLVAATVVMLAVHALVMFHVIGWDWANLPAWVAAPLVVLGLAAIRSRPPRWEMLLLAAGVVLAVLGFGVALDLAASLLLAHHRDVPPPTTWLRDLAIVASVTVCAFTCAWFGLKRRVPPGHALRWALLVASIPFVGSGCLALWVWAVDLPLSA